jgi:hypothetical protein
MWHYRFKNEIISVGALTMVRQVHDHEEYKDNKLDSICNGRRGDDVEVVTSPFPTVLEMWVATLH